MNGVNQTKVNSFEEVNRELENIRKLLVDLPAYSGNGSPENSISAKVGAFYLDTLKGIMYQKESGDGNKTGWLRLGFELVGVIKPYSGAVTSWTSTLTDGTTAYSKNRHLFCNGASVSISTYQDLYDEIGTTWNLCAKQDGTGGNYTKPSSGFFRIPDLRGLFLRGAGTSSLADGTGDVAVTLGAFTEDKMQGNYRGISVGAVVIGRFVGVQSGTSYTVPADGGANTDVVRSHLTDGTNGTPRTGLETAPKNVGINYVISY